MPFNGHDVYFESKVLGANPVELVEMLYRACTESVKDARFHLSEGRIAERSKAINKAYEILVELTGSLDHARGGEIAQRLGLLYDYMERRLLDANMQQAEAPLNEVLGLLATLSEAWEGVRMAQSSPVFPPSHEWTRPAACALSASEWSPSYLSPAAPANPWAQPVDEAPTGYSRVPWAEAPGDEGRGTVSHAWSL